VVTVAQLKSERRRAFRKTRQSLNVVRKAFNLLHRQLDRRLEGHYTELLDVKDAEHVTEKAYQMDVLWNNFKRDMIANLEAFFL
jgi:hypothetical protein